MTDLRSLELGGELHVRSEEERILELRVFPWDTVGRTTEGPERIRRGALEGTDPARVTLEAIGPHGAEPGVRLAGRALSIEELDDGAHASFRVARTAAGDELLGLVREGVYRDASAVFEAIPGQFRRVGGVTEHARINLVRVGIVERGAYPTAEVLAVRSRGDALMLETPNPTPTPTPTPEPPDPGAGGVRIPTTDANAAAITALRDDMLGRMTALEARGGGRASSPLARWSSLGAYLRDASEDPDSAVLLARALVDQVTTDNPGVVPPSILRDVVGIMSSTREAIAAFGGARSLGDSGMTLTWPYYDGDLSTLVAKQAAEKTDIHSVKVSLKQGSTPIHTYAGGSDISYQLIRRSSPSYLEAYGRIMLAGWGVTTEADFEAALLAGATGSIIVDPLTATDAQLRAAFFGASSKVKAATGAPASVCLASPDAFQAIGGVLVPPAYGTANVTGTAQASTLRINVSGLEVVEAPFFPSGTLLFGNEAAAGWAEDGPMIATAEDVAKLGQNRAIWSMGATEILVPAGLVKSAASAGRAERAR